MTFVHSLFTTFRWRLDGQLRNSQTDSTRRHQEAERSYFSGKKKWVNNDLRRFDHARSYTHETCRNQQTIVEFLVFGTFVVEPRIQTGAFLLRVQNDGRIDVFLVLARHRRRCRWNVRGPRRCFSRLNIGISRLWTKTSRERDAYTSTTV